MRPLSRFWDGVSQKQQGWAEVNCQLQKLLQIISESTDLHYCTFKDFSMDLNHYGLESFECCKVVCSATHPQSLHQCSCSSYQKVQDFNKFIVQLWKIAHPGRTVHLLLTHAVVLKVVFYFQIYWLSPFLNVPFRPPVSRAAPQPEKLQKNNVNKKKKLVEVRINIF